MTHGLQSTVSTLLASLYLLVAAAGHGLHVHSHGPRSAESAGCACHGCHTGDLADADSTQATFRQAPNAQVEEHDCVACSMLAKMRLAGGVAGPAVQTFSKTEFVAVSAVSVVLGPAICLPVARGPPSLA